MINERDMKDKFFDDATDDMRFWIDYTENNKKNPICRMLTATALRFIVTAEESISNRVNELKQDGEQYFAASQAIELMIKALEELTDSLKISLGNHENKDLQ